MRFFTDKKIESFKREVVKETTSSLIKNITSKRPQKSSIIDKIIKEQLERVTLDLSNWRQHVEAAEDIDSPDRVELMEDYKEFIDDYQLWAVMQSRINKSTSGNFKIMGIDGKIDEEETGKFLDPQGMPHPWFRSLMIAIVKSKFYGHKAIQLGNIIDDTFDKIEEVPDENNIPYFDAVIKDSSKSFILGGDNVIFYSDPIYDNWVIRTGSKTDLGLINKCAPYIIYKRIFGNWSQHASIFGMPMRLGTTDLQDPERKQNLIDAFTEQEGSSWVIKDLNDEVEYMANSGTDPHQIYGMLIDKCDSAISKIVLSQTGTTDEKAYSGSANVHADTEYDVIFSDKLDIKSVVNEQLIPKMKKIGMIAESKKIFGGWDHSEELSIKDWADVITRLSQSGFSVDPEDIEKYTTIKVDPTIIATPENKTISIMNKINSLYGKDNS